MLEITAGINISINSKHRRSCCELSDLFSRGEIGEYRTRFEPMDPVI